MKQSDFGTVLRITELPEQVFGGSRLPQRILQDFFGLLMSSKFPPAVDLVTRGVGSVLRTLVTMADYFSVDLTYVNLLKAVADHPAVLAMD